MGDVLKRIFVRLAFWRKTPPVHPVKPTAVVGEDYLCGFEGHYRAFQGNFLSYLRANQDGKYWARMSLRDMAAIGGNWARTEYAHVPDRDQIHWWIIDRRGLPVDKGIGL
jgi:hypothetical protein